MPSVTPKATKPVDPNPDLRLINPDPDGQSMRLIRWMRRFQGERSSCSRRHLRDQPTVSVLGPGGLLNQPGTRVT